MVKVFSADKNYEVIAWDRKEIDITDETQVKDKVSALAPQIIVNAAAYNAVDKAEEPAEFELAKKLNGLAPGYLAKVAKEIKIPPVKGRGPHGALRPNPPFTKWGKGAIFVHYSTDYVFDGEKKEGYWESDKPSPICNYGFSKLMGEQAVARVGGQYYIIRLQKLFGCPAQSAFAKKSFFEVMLELAKTKKELEVVDEELANFTYAPDLAARTKWLVETADLRGAEIPRINAEINLPTPLSVRGADAEQYPFGIYHITNEGAPATWYGAVKILFEIIKDCHSRPVSRYGVSSGGNPGPGSPRIKCGAGWVKPGMTELGDIKLTPVSADKFHRPAKRPKYSILLNTKLPSLRPWPEALKEFFANR